MYTILAIALYALPFAAAWFVVAAGAPWLVGLAVGVVLFMFVAAGFSGGPSRSAPSSYGGDSTFIYVSETDHCHHHDDGGSFFGGDGGCDGGGD